MGKRGVETTVETAVMIQGRARRKTMKRPRLNPMGSHPRKRTPVKQWLATTRSPSVESKVAHQRKKQLWKALVTLQGLTHRNLNACLCPGRQQSAWSAAGCDEREGVSKRGVETTVETSVMIQGQAHRKTMKRPRLNPLSLIQRR